MAGGAIGIPPHAVNQCSLGEFRAAVEGWRKANSPDEGPKPPTPDEHDEMIRKYG